MFLQTALQIIGTDISIVVIETPNAGRIRHGRSIPPRRALVTSRAHRKLSPARPSVELENADGENDTLLPGGTPRDYPEGFSCKIAIELPLKRRCVSTIRKGARMDDRAGYANFLKESFRRCSGKLLAVLTASPDLTPLPTGCLAN